MYFEEFEEGIQIHIDNVAIEKSDMLNFAKKYDLKRETRHNCDKCTK